MSPNDEVDPAPCNAQTNAHLTLFLRVFLDQVNPAGATGTHADADGTMVPIVRWTPDTWAHFCSRYQRICEDFWTGRIWLGTPVGYLLFTGEQHGFRKSDNISRSLDAELYFYAVNVFRTGLVF